MLKIHFYYLKYTNYNKYVVESPEPLIRKLLSIRIEKEKCVKLRNMLKTCFFDQKMIILSHKSQNAQHVRTSIIWI